MTDKGYGNRSRITLNIYLFTLFMIIFCIGILGTHSLAESLCGDDITWSLSDGILTLSGEGGTYDYNAQAAPWYSRREEVTSVEIDSHIYYLGDHLLEDCPNLESISYAPQNVSFGYCALNNLPSLTEYRIV